MASGDKTDCHSIKIRWHDYPLIICRESKGIGIFTNVAVLCRSVKVGTLCAPLRPTDLFLGIILLYMYCVVLLWERDIIYNVLSYKESHNSSRPLVSICVTKCNLAPHCRCATETFNSVYEGIIHVIHNDNGSNNAIIDPVDAKLFFSVVNYFSLFIFHLKRLS